MRTFTTFILFIGAVSMTFAQSQSGRQLYGADATRPFSGAAKAGGFIYVAGTIGADASNKGDIKAQTKATLESIDRTLKQAGSSLASVVSTTIYLRNAADFPGMNEAYGALFPKDPPARTTVVVTQPLANPDGLIEIAAVAVPNGGQRTVIHPSDWMRSPAPYNYGIKSGNTLFMSGLISRNGKDNQNVKGDMAAQMKVIFDNATAILKQADMSLADVVSSRVYITDETQFQAMNAAYRPNFTATSMPARATVKVGLTSPDYIVEIQMIAVKDAGRKTGATPNADGTMPAAAANANLSAAIQVGNRLYVSGITGNTAQNKGDAKAQTAECLTRIERTLKAAGYDWSNVVDAVVYLPDMNNYQAMNAAYREKLMKEFPARATVGTGLMGADAQVEIMMTAVK
ncbi:MAG TPA: RidA family protein [Vicinamibacterales bacterium]|nr:RidA family protein [Vicinamibacterales bacterium]